VLSPAEIRAAAQAELPDDGWWTSIGEIRKDPDGYWYATPLDDEGLCSADRPDNTGCVIRVDPETGAAKFIESFYDIIAGREVLVSSRFDSPVWPHHAFRGELVDPEIPSGTFWLRHPDRAVLEGPFDGMLWQTDPETNVAYSSNYPAHSIELYCVARDGRWLTLLEPDNLSTYTVELITDEREMVTQGIVDPSLTSAYLRVHAALNDAANELEILAMDLRVLVCMVEYASQHPAINTEQIGHITGLVTSNVRASLYRLAEKGLIAFVQKTRGRVLIVRASESGEVAVRTCVDRWRSQ
jgi:hypothetical protein